ncbi:universal stress protein [bacterium]|nr:universal stress protein [bacterium]
MKILVPLDGSDLSESVLPCALDMARRHQAELVLVRATEHFGTIAPGLPPDLGLQLQEQAQKKSINYLESMQSHLPGVAVNAQAPLGPARDEIYHTAVRQKCDLIIMASRAREGPARWLLGSVAEAVLRQSPCPVLLLRPPAGQSSLFQHILVPIDGSEASLAVLHKVQPYLAPGGKVTLLQSSDLSLYPYVFDVKSETVQEYLNQLEADLRKIEVEGLTLEVTVLDGDPIDAILTWSQENDCDLIAMSTHGRTGFRRFWLGSVTEKVARHSHCPVLAFPGRE